VSGFAFGVLNTVFEDVTVVFIGVDDLNGVNPVDLGRGFLGVDFIFFPLSI